ncbi:MAG: PA2779 family protein [Acidobacteriaceae bacterium]|nr:PA2779 family protein [Acidobacteriaceae bacterium]
MKSRLWSAVLIPFALASAFATPQVARAEDHVVALDELHQNARVASERRAKDIGDIERVLSYPAAAQALERSNVSQDQMRQAVATLSNDELARLADRARASEKDVQGGLIVGILALIGLIVVIIIVVTVVA